MSLQFQLVGYRYYEFTTDDNRHMEGTSFYVVRPPSSSGVVGSEAVKMSVRQDIVDRCGKPEVGAIYDVLYDQKGKIAEYRLAKHAPMPPAPGVTK